MDFTCTAGQFGMQFKSIRFGVRLSTTTDPTVSIITSLSTKSRYEVKLRAYTPGGLLMHPSSIRQAFQIRPSQCETFFVNGFRLVL